MTLVERCLAGCFSLVVAASVPSLAAAQFCGDPDRDGNVTVADGVQVLRAAAFLSSNCELDTCDVDASGDITVVDGVSVLRAAASLPNPCDDETGTPTPGVTPTPNPTPTGGKRVFVTSTVHSGGFGGTSGADSICAARASAAGIDGTFLAWVSDTASSPSTRFVQSALPYRLIDGRIVADDWSDLTDGQLANPINCNENGVLVGGDAWTGTETDGTADAARCNDWASSDGSVTGQCGSIGLVGVGWTAAQTPFCDILLRLYCFEQ